MTTTTFRTLAGALLVALLAVTTPAAGPLSRTFQFERRAPLELGLVDRHGLRIDTVRFLLPDAAARTAGVARADVAISNTSTVALRVGLAVALFDAEGALVGVASGGTRFRGLKPGRQDTYSLTFDHVNERIHSAATFQITLESE